MNRLFVAFLLFALSLQAFPKEISKTRDQVRAIRAKNDPRLKKLFAHRKDKKLDVFDGLGIGNNLLSHTRFPEAITGVAQIDRWTFGCQRIEGTVTSKFVTGDNAFSLVGSNYDSGPCPLYVDVKFDPQAEGKYEGKFCVSGIHPDLGPWTECMDMVGTAVGEPKDPNCKIKVKSSVLRMDNKSVSEEIPVQGTDFNLVYSSNLAPNYKSTFTRPVLNPSFNPEGVSISIQHFFNKSDKRLFKGDGDIFIREFHENSIGEVFVVDGDEVFVFQNTSGKHLRTLSKLTGFQKYKFSYDANNKLIKITNSYGRDTLINRDTNGALTSITSEYNEITNIGLNVDGLVTSVTSPAGYIYQIIYNEDNQFISQFIKPNLSVTSFEFSGTGWLLSEEKNGGSSWMFDYYTDPEEPGFLFTERISKLERYNSTLTKKDPVTGLYMRKTFSPEGFETLYTEGDDNSSSASNMYESNSNTTTNDERFGNLSPRSATQTDTIGTIARNSVFTSTVAGAKDFGDFFNFSQITNNISTNGIVSNHSFSKENMTHTFTNAMGVQNKVVIDNFEKPISIQHANDVPLSISYDIRGRVVQTNQGTSNTVQYTYNNKGKIASIKNALNQVTSYLYNVAGDLVRITNPDGREVRYQYNSVGQITKIIPPNGLQHIFTFNGMELPATYRPPTIAETTTPQTRYTYDLDKQLTSIIRPDGKKVRFVYEEELGQLMAVILGVNERQNYAYYPLSNKVRSINSPDQVRSVFSYFGNDNLATEIQTVEDVDQSRIDYDYDSFFRQNRRIVKMGTEEVSRVITSYRTDNQPLKIGELRLNYDATSGRLTTTVLQNVRDSRTYDAYGNLASYRVTFVPESKAVTELYYFSLTRDVLHRITTKVERVQGVQTTYNYSYDSVGRLSSVVKNGVVDSSFTYDLNSNRVSGTQNGIIFSANFDAQDRIESFQLAGSAVMNFTHNANGELTKILQGSNSTLLSSDSLGRLKSVVLPNGSQVSYKLDWDGRRVSRLINGTQVDRNIFENTFRIAVSKENGVVKEYVYGTSVNSPDYVKIDNTIYRVFKDHLGSPRIIVNTVDGSIAQRMDYNEWGKVVLDSNPGFQAYGFAGGLYDRSTGFVKFGARDYAPEIGRWLSKDPIRFNGGDTNLYGYVLQDPVNFKDFNGQKVDIPMNSWPHFPLIDLIGDKIDSFCKGLGFCEEKSGDSTPKSPEPTEPEPEPKPEPKPEPEPTEEAGVCPKNVKMRF